MEYKYLDKINTPDDIKLLNYSELEVLSQEIRDYIIKVVSLNGGHLASNLGVVELTIALHRVFDSPTDKFIWDVGHQSYVHKILTGRRLDFKSIRLYEGLSGFPKRCESEHDIFETGHSSTSISAGLGIAAARDLKKENYSVVSIIGDGAMSGGMSFEGLNHAGHLKSKFIVILNDNEMSISTNIGGMSKYLSRIRTGKTYFKFKNKFGHLLKAIPFIGKSLFDFAEKVRDYVKYIMINGIIFEKLGFKYFGPVDGHDLKTLEKVMNQIKQYEGHPILLHVVTKKGKGYDAAEKNPEKYHGISPKSQTCVKENTQCSELTFEETDIPFSNVLGNKLSSMSIENNRIIAITAAMPEGTGLKDFSIKYPDRFFDVAIAEQHAVTFGAGLSSQGFIPVFAVYSTFLQRAYDQIVHDVAMQKLPFVFAIDRAGLVGADGETHHGIFDISYTSHIPNLTVLSPKDKTELEDMLEFSINNKLTCAIRYPRGLSYDFVYDNRDERKQISINLMETIRKGEKIAIISEGCSFRKSAEIINYLIRDGFNPALYNARFISPFDEETLLEIADKYSFLFSIEENIGQGGMGERIAKILTENKKNIDFTSFAYPKDFIKHGDVYLLEKECKMDSESIYEQIISRRI